MDLSTPNAVLLSLQSQGYLIMFLLMILEGPIINYAAAFASSLNIFNVYLVLLIAILGNFVGDIIYYSIGKLGKHLVIDKYIKSSINKNKIKKIRDFLKTHPGKTLAVIKITPPLPTPGLILAGASGMPFKTFIFYSTIVSIITCSIVTVLGFYSGAAFSIIANYINQTGLLIGIAVASIIIFYILFKLISKKVSNKIEKI